MRTLMNCQATFSLAVIEIALTNRWSNPTLTKTVTTPGAWQIGNAVKHGTMIGKERLRALPVNYFSCRPTTSPGLHRYETPNRAVKRRGTLVRMPGHGAVNLEINAFVDGSARERSNGSGHKPGWKTQPTGRASIRGSFEWLNGSTTRESVDVFE